MRIPWIATVAAFGLGVLVGAAALVAWTPAVPPPDKIHPVWTAAKWPFPVDQWGTGKAFSCKASDCGTEAALYLRAKIGFCNCTTGVADDQELERVADFDLLGERGTALAPGRAISVRWMKGRSAAHSVSASGGATRSVLTIAFNDRCDVIVATVVAGHNRPALLEPGALEFLNGDTAMRWAETALGL
jgi:hypothetical protein